MIKCGSVTDRSAYAKDHLSQKNMDAVKDWSEHCKRRIYSDEVPIADKKKLEYLRLSKMGRMHDDLYRKDMYGPFFNLTKEHHGQRNN